MPQSGDARGRQPPERGEDGGRLRQNAAGRRSGVPAGPSLGLNAAVGEDFGRTSPLTRSAAVGLGGLDLAGRFQKAAHVLSLTCSDPSQGHGKHHHKGQRAAGAHLHKTPNGMILKSENSV